MTNILTFPKAPLLSERERGIGARSIPEGVYEGLVPVEGSSGFNISVTAGVYAIQGVLVEEDAKYTDQYTLSSDTHAQFFVYLYNGDQTDPFLDYLNDQGIDPDSIGYQTGTPFYGVVREADVSGDLNQRIPYDKNNVNQYALFFGEAFIPASATHIGSPGVRLVAYDRVDTPHVFGDHPYLLVNGEVSIEKPDSSTLRLGWEDMVLFTAHDTDLSKDQGFMTQHPIEGPYTKNTETLTPSTAWALDTTIDVSTQGIIYYLTSGNKKLRSYPVPNDSEGDWRDFVGDSRGYNTNDLEARPSIEAKRVIGVAHNTPNGWHLQLRNGIQCKIDHPFTGQRDTNHMHTLTSTTYGTSIETKDGRESEAGEINLGDVLLDIGGIKNISLDEVYDQWTRTDEHGDGRQIEVDAGPVRFDHRPDTSKPDVEGFRSGLLAAMQDEERHAAIDVSEHYLLSDAQDGYPAVRHRNPASGTVTGVDWSWFQESIQVEVKTVSGTQYPVITDIDGPGATFQSAKDIHQDLDDPKWTLDRGILDIESHDPVYGLTYNSPNNVYVIHKISPEHDPYAYTSRPYGLTNNQDEDFSPDSNYEAPPLSNFGLSGGGSTTISNTTLWVVTRFGQHVQAQKGLLESLRTDDLNALNGTIKHTNVQNITINNQLVSNGTSLFSKGLAVYDSLDVAGEAYFNDLVRVLQSKLKVSNDDVALEVDEGITQLHGASVEMAPSGVIDVDAPLDTNNSSIQIDAATTFSGNATFNGRVVANDEVEFQERPVFQSDKTYRAYGEAHNGLVGFTEQGVTWSESDYDLSTGTRSEDVDIYVLSSGATKTIEDTLYEHPFLWTGVRHENNVPSYLNWIYREASGAADNQIPGQAHVRMEVPLDIPLPCDLTEIWFDVYFDGATIRRIALLEQRLGNIYAHHWEEDLSSDVTKTISAPNNTLDEDTQYLWLHVETHNDFGSTVAPEGEVSTYVEYTSDAMHRHGTT